MGPRITKEAFCELFILYLVAISIEPWQTLTMAESEIGKSVGDDSIDSQPKGSGAVILGAAMLAMGEIIEPDKTSVEIAEVADEYVPEKGIDLDFGELPPID